jgi:hypothetical protein
MPYNNAGQEFVIISKEKGKRSYIRFIETGYECIASNGNIKTGSVKDLFNPSVYGVGFVGAGPHKVSDNQKHTKEYRLWTGMLERCYSAAYQGKFPTYIGCSVDEQWHNFQEFAEWCQWQKGFKEKDYHLDKDILSLDIKSYSPSTCCFVHKDINTFLNVNTKQRGMNFLGIYEHCNKYIPRINYKLTDKVRAKACETPEEAFTIYRDWKIECVKVLIERYHENMEYRVIEKFRLFDVTKSM